MQQPRMTHPLTICETSTTEGITERIEIRKLDRDTCLRPGSRVVKEKG